MHMQMAMVNSLFSQRNNKIDKDQTSKIHLTPLELEKLQTETRLDRLQLDSSSNNILDSKQIKPPYSRMEGGGG